MSEYKIYKGLFNDETIKYILENVDEKNYSTGRVGTRVNLNQKRRKDLHINNPETLKVIDNFFYDKLYPEIKCNFSDIKIYDVTSYTPGKSINYGVTKCSNDYVLILSAHSQIMNSCTL